MRPFPPACFLRTSRLKAFLSANISTTTHGSPHFSRIQIHRPSDLSRLYPFITSFISTPELACSVKEVIFRYEASYEPYDFGGVQTQHEWFIQLDAQHLSEKEEMSKAIPMLGLHTDSEETHWLKSLSWGKPELLAEREKFLKNTNAGKGAHLYIEQHNSIFAHYATALLLMLCPNVETLVYKDTKYGGSAVENLMRKNNYDALPGRHLQKLKDVILLATDECSIGDERVYIKTDILNLLRMFHRLPDIESVTVGGVGPDPDGDYADEIPPGSRNLKKIHVTHSSFGSDKIAALAQVPKGLEVFTVTTGGRSTVDGSFEPLHRKEIGKALLCQKSSLQVLDLDLDECLNHPASCDIHMAEKHDLEREQDHIEERLPNEHQEWHSLETQVYVTDRIERQRPLGVHKLPDDREYGPTIGSLHDFSQLTHLSIGISLLLGAVGPNANDQDQPPFRLVDALPLSLQYLRIYGYKKNENSMIDGHISELMSVRSEKLPNLKEIHGIDEHLPSAASIEDPDGHPELLWKEPETISGWVEVDADSG